MRILLVGAGGVGHGIRPDRRPPRLRRAGHRRLRPGAAPSTRRRRRTATRPSGWTPGTRQATAALLTGHALRRADERHRPAVRHATVPCRAAGRHALPGHGHVAVTAHTRTSPTARPGSSSATSSSPWPVSGSSGASSRWRAWAWSPACPTCSPATPPTRSSPASTRSVSGTVRISRCAGYDFAPTFSIWTTIEECLNPPVIWETRRGLVHHATVLRARDLHLPGRDRPGGVRERRARRGAADPPLGRRQAGDVQVRPRGRVHRRAGDPAQDSAWTAPIRCRAGGVSVSPRDVVAACLPDPATLGDKMTGLTCAGTWVTGTGTDGGPREVYLLPRGGQCLVDGRVRLAGRGLADGGEPGRGAGADRRRAPGRARACSAPRRCPPGPSSTCSPTTAHRGRCEERTPASGGNSNSHSETEASWCRNCRTSSVASGRTCPSTSAPSWSTRAPARCSPRRRCPARPRWTRPCPRPRRPSTDGGTPPPPSAAWPCCGSPTRSRPARTNSSRPKSENTGKPLGAHRVRGDPADGGPDQVLRGRGPDAGRPLGGRVHVRVHLDHPARADRRVRGGHAVELPDDDGGVEVGPGARGRATPWCSSRPTPRRSPRCSWPN